MTAYDTQNADREDLSLDNAEDSADEVQMEFSEQAAKLLCELASRTQQDAGQVVSNALGVYDWVEKQHAMGLNVVGTNKAGQPVNTIDFPESSAQSGVETSPRSQDRSKSPRILARFLRRLAG
ncbi:MAG: hypothetical protein AAFP20_10870 [Cyanobacteria bacterium J06614_10]